MVQKSEVHNKLPLIFERDGVRPKIIVYKSKEQSLGAFVHKCREAEYHLVNIKPCLPWSQMYEECIRELKRGSSIQLIKTGSSKHLWGHCIELQAFMSSHTAHSNYELEGKVPETCMNRQTADISKICNYSWYEWVIFRDQPITYPDLSVILGLYFGMTIDVRSSMSYKILKENGEYVCRTTVHSLNPTEIAY